MSDTNLELVKPNGADLSNEALPPVEETVPSAESTVLDLPRHLADALEKAELATRLAALEVEAAQSRLSAATAEARNLYSAVADEMGYRFSQVAFQVVPRQDGTNRGDIKLVVGEGA